MKFEVGKFYKTRGGHKAQIFLLDNGNGWMFGAILLEGWIQVSWRNDTGATAVNSYPQDSYSIVGEWKEPAKPKLLAPALYRGYDGKMYTTTQVFGNENDARKVCGNYLVQWPAKVNADGFYEAEVPGDE